MRRCQLFYEKDSRFCILQSYGHNDVLQAMADKAKQMAESIRGNSLQGAEDQALIDHLEAGAQHLLQAQRHE